MRWKVRQTGGVQKQEKQYKDRGTMSQSEMMVNPDRDKVRQADGEKSKQIGTR